MTPLVGGGRGGGRGGGSLVGNDINDDDCSSREEEEGVGPKADDRSFSFDRSLTIPP